jgi:lipid-A-disaccharide synthase
VPDAEFIGVGGEAMRASGLVPLASMEALSINGFVEPLKRLPALLRLFRALRERFLRERIDAFVGIDFNVFNLILERALKRRGVRTIHYVSPSVYAWRAGRVRRIGRAADLVMTLFPFEPQYYRARGVAAVYVGHPLADAIEPVDPTATARAALGIDPRATIVAMLPGSRRSEIDAHGELFLATAEHFTARRRASFVVPCVSAELRDRFAALAATHASLDLRVMLGGSSDALAACDVALVKSGTGTLEAMLLGKPMVVTYRLPALSYRVVKFLFRSPHVALPNILAGKRIVPELLQDDARPDALAAALERELEASRHDDARLVEFRRLHRELRRSANDRAADAVLELVAAAR